MLVRLRVGQRRVGYPFAVGCGASTALADLGFMAVNATYQLNADGSADVQATLTSPRGQCPVLDVAASVNGEPMELSGDDAEQGPSGGLFCNDASYRVDDLHVDASEDLTVEFADSSDSWKLVFPDAFDSGFELASPEDGVATTGDLLAITEIHGRPFATDWADVTASLPELGLVAVSYGLQADSGVAIETDGAWEGNDTVTVAGQVDLSGGTCDGPAACALTGWASDSISVAVRPTE